MIKRLSGLNNWCGKVKDWLMVNGEMAERSKAAVLKTVVPLWDRGFESLSLR
jgi:hypothetical protein